jgi:hypothetical protein
LLRGSVAQVQSKSTRPSSDPRRDRGGEVVSVGVGVAVAVSGSGVGVTWVVSVAEDPQAVAASRVSAVQ